MVSKFATVFGRPRALAAASHSETDVRWSLAFAVHVPLVSWENWDSGASA